jgi:hypothetical protein
VPTYQPHGLWLGDQWHPDASVEGEELAVLECDP